MLAGYSPGYGIDSGRIGINRCSATINRISQVQLVTTLLQNPPFYSGIAIFPGIVVFRGRTPDVANHPLPCPRRTLCSAEVGLPNPTPCSHLLPPTASSMAGAGFPRFPSQASRPLPHSGGSDPTTRGAVSQYPKPCTASIGNQLSTAPGVFLPVQCVPHLQGRQWCVDHP